MDATTTKPLEEEKAPDVAERSQKRMFEYSAWVDVGPGAEDCEGVDKEAGTVECSSPLHFHAWCRLPNQYQHREIRDKALAARARKARQLRDPESDAFVVMEDQLEQIKAQGDEGRQEVIDELLNKDLWRDMVEVQADLDEHEKAGEKVYEHIREDRRRHAEIMEMDEDARPADELKSLIRHLAAYDKDFEKRMEAKVKPRREGLESQSIDELLEASRGDRVERDAQEEFAHTYATWMWLFGTYRFVRGPRVWEELGQMESAAPEVLEALQETYGDLERAHLRDAEGNP